tara:strand:- start:104 stop:1042 length:939 start_codon:yes stop_codon:yes gene_type:complete
MINKNSKIYLTGHTGLVGSSILRLLKNKGFKKILFARSDELDLRDQKKVFKFLNKYKPEFVINAAAKVGGIQANNSLKGEFIYDNLAIETNIIHGSYINNIKNLIFLGSSCIYPRNSSQPIKEKNLLTGLLEKTNEPYAIAKIAGIKMCESYNFQYKTNFKCLMPCNTFGPNDNYDLNTSHFLPALIKKIHQAKIKKKKSVLLWGNGKARRELIYVDDIADACLFFLKKKTKESLINIGSSFEKTILEYAKLVANVLDFKVKFELDTSKPNGTLRKKLDNTISRNYGWKPYRDIKKSILITYEDFLKKENKN